MASTRQNPIRDTRRSLKALVLLAFVALVGVTIAARSASDLLYGSSLSSSSRSERVRVSHARFLAGDQSCAEHVQDKFQCDDLGCRDHVAGFVNYLMLWECGASSAALQALVMPFLVLWMLLMIYLMQETTDEYFCLTLQHLVSFFKMTPSVAGVTFLAVGNGAMDVGSSVAAFASGVPKLGVGSLLGAGIFVTTLCLATVAIVSETEVNKSEFLRDVWFFFFSVFYLLVSTLDGTITFLEAIGFLVIYVVFVVCVFVYARTCAEKTSTQADWTSSEEKVSLVTSESSEMLEEQEKLTSAVLDTPDLAGGSPAHLRPLPGAAPSPTAPSPPAVAGTARTAEDLVGRPRRKRALSDDSLSILRMNSDWTAAFLKTVEDGTPARAARARQHREAQSRSLKIRGLLLGVREQAGGDVELKVMSPGGAASPSESDVEEEKPLEPLPADASCWMKLARCTTVSLNFFNKYYCKLMDFLCIPFTWARAVTIPLLEAGKWDWRYAVVIPTLSPMMMMGVGAPAAVGPGGIPLFALAGIVGFIVSVVLFFTINRKDIPSSGFSYVAWVFTSFVMSLGWVWAIANELVSLIVMFGALAGISDIVMGCCFLAIGSSISDFAANTTIAKEGFPGMAVAATYAGPMFNVLMGLGLPLVIYGWKNGTFYLGHDTTVTYLSFATLMCALLSAAIIVPLQDYKVSKAYAYFLLIAYMFYLVAVFVLAGLYPQEGEE